MKGDKGRFDPEQKAKYRDNYDAIFSKKPVVNTGEKRTAMDAEKVRSRVGEMVAKEPFEYQPVRSSARRSIAELVEATRVSMDKQKVPVENPLWAWGK